MYTHYRTQKEIVEPVPHPVIEIRPAELFVSAMLKVVLLSWATYHGQSVIKRNGFYVKFHNFLFIFLLLFTTPVYY